MLIVSEIFAKAEEHIRNSNYNHAFIDFFVGLDFFLAPDTEKSKKLKQRITLLTYQYFETTFKKHISHLNDLYDMRSNYVHNGKNIYEGDLIEIRNLSRLILGVLFNLHKDNLNKIKISYNDWLVQIDTMVQKAYNGIDPSQSQLRMLGAGNLSFVILQDSLDKYDLN